MRHVLENYVKKDLHHQTQAETKFEEATGIEFIGDFSIEHIEWMEEFMERTYGVHNVHNYFGTKRLIILPESVNLIGKSEKCSHKQSTRHTSYSGYAAASGDIVVKIVNPQQSIALHNAHSVKDVILNVAKFPVSYPLHAEQAQKDLFFRILGHELAHHFHFKSQKPVLRNNS